MVTRNEESSKKSVYEITTALIFAAGLGTRLKPWTDLHPKALVPVNGKPLLQRNIEYLKSYGIRRMVINAHHFAVQIEDFLKTNHYFDCDISLSHEEEAPLETGGGLKRAAPLLDLQHPFFVINADILSNLNIREMKRYHDQYRPLVTLAVTNRKASRSFLFTGENQLCGWCNNKTGEQKISIPSVEYIPRAFSGMHIIDPDIFQFITEEGKFSLVDLYLRLSQQHAIRSFDHSGDILVDVGKPEAIELAERHFH